MLDGLFDYAGLYPPTILSLEEAFANYLRYLDGEESLVTNRFICPSAKLTTLASLVLAQSRADLRISVTASEDLMGDYQAITSFEATVGQLATVYGYELKLNPEMPMAEQIAHFGGDAGLDEFLEIPWNDEISDSIALIAEHEGPYAKARCGGGYIPTPKELAQFLKATISLEVPFKLTAGLHHPFASGGNHGFFNALVASALILHEDLPVSTTARVLAEENANEFVISDDQVGWQDLVAPLDSIVEMRSIFLNIGSCSIEEPLADLRENELIPTSAV